jgi:hypothetical protein
MEYVLAFAIISHVYAFAYMVRDEKLNVYRLSVVLLLTLVGMCAGMLLFGTFSNLKFIDRLANEFFHGVLVQSFICHLHDCLGAYRLQERSLGIFIAQYCLLYGISDYSFSQGTSRLRHPHPNPLPEGEGIRHRG